MAQGFIKVSSADDGLAWAQCGGSQRNTVRDWRLAYVDRRDRSTDHRRRPQAVHPLKATHPIEPCSWCASHAAKGLAKTALNQRKGVREAAAPLDPRPLPHTPACAVHLPWPAAICLTSSSQTQLRMASAQGAESQLQSTSLLVRISPATASCLQPETPVSRVSELIQKSPSHQKPRSAYMLPAKMTISVGI